MFELEDQLDYEPDNSYEEQNIYENRRYSDIVHYSGPLDQNESLSGSTLEEQNPSFKTTSEMLPINKPNFRDKMNYLHSHIDLQNDSFRRKYGTYLTSREFHSLDSSSDEESQQYENDEQPETASEVLRNVLSDLEYPFGNESLVDYETPSETDYCESLNKSESNNNTKSVTEYQEKSEANKNEPDQNDIKVTENSCTFSYNNTSQKSPKTKNFSITIMGNSRLISLKEKNQRPWNTKLEDIEGEKSIMKLTSLDKNILYDPSWEMDHREQDACSNSQTSSESATGTSTFKVPLRRPPTRQKPKLKNLSISVDLNSQRMNVTPLVNPCVAKLDQDNLDIISLTASTFDDNLENRVEQENNVFPKDEPCRSPIEQSRWNRISEWLEQSKPKEYVQTKELPKFPKVPYIYMGLCFNHFFNGSCLRGYKCKNSHDLKSSMTKLKNMRELSNDELIEAYKFATGFPVFFVQIYRIFADAFAEKDLKSDLINMIHIIFEKNEHSIAKSEGLKNILESLQKTELCSFEDAVEYLLVQIGLRQYPVLGYILLEIICTKENLTTYWSIIRKLVVHGEKMTADMSSKFLVQLIKDPVDLNLCMEVYQNNLKYQFMDFTQIASAVTRNFRRICLGQKSFSPKNLLTEYGSVPNDQLEFASQTSSDKTFPLSLGSGEYPDLTTATSDLFTAGQSDFRKFGPLMLNTDNQLGSFSKNVRDAERYRTNLSDSSFEECSLFIDPLNQKKTHSTTSLKYNWRGLEYDPDNDYLPPRKKSLKPLPSRSVQRVNNNSEIWQSVPEVVEEISYRKERAYKRRKSNSETFHGVKADEIRNEASDKAGSSNTNFHETKPPEHPEFGKLNFNAKYEFNVSLHNLYLHKISNIDIDEEDVLKLNDCIKLSNGKTFLELLEKYKHPLTVQNFISMTLAHLNGMNQMVAKCYANLLSNIEKEKPDFYDKVTIRVILEVITMNLLFELNKRNKSEAAKNLLEKFSDWNSLITSRLFICNNVSIVGRYLFIAKLLLPTKPELSYEILVCPTFHLLEDYRKWPYPFTGLVHDIVTSDMHTRKTVLDLLLKEGYLLNTLVVTQLYKTALEKKIWDFDVTPYIDPMIVTLINKKQIIPLKQILNQIELLSVHTNKDTLRALLIFMFRHLNNRHAFRLFNCCVERGIYQRLVKNEMMEYNVQLKTNMHNEEIEIIILNYFHKLAEIRNLPPGSQPLKFEITLPDEQNERFAILKTERSIQKINEELRSMLLKFFSLESNTIVPCHVTVEKDKLIEHLDRNRSC